MEGAPFAQRLGADGVRIDRWEPILARNLKPIGRESSCVATDDISAGNNRTDLASIEAAYFDNIQLSPDGQKIAFAAQEDGKDNIRVISMAGGENAKIIANVDPTVYVSGIAWSPDSKAVYYSKQKQVGTISMIENFK